MNLKTKVCGLVGAALVAGTVGFFVSSPALADTAGDLQAKLEAAQSRLDSLYDQAGQISEQLNGTKVNLANTEAQIEESNQKIASTEADIKAKEAELAERRARLGDTVAQDYKSGGVNFLSIILNAGSFDDFVSRVYYADKISSQQASDIQATKDLQASLENQKVTLQATKGQLEQQKAEQTELLSQQQAQQDQLSASVSEAESYVNGLDADVKAKLAEEQQAHAAEQAQAASTGQAQVAATVNDALSNAGTTNGGNASNGGNNGGGTSNNGGNTSSNTSKPSSPSKPSGSTSSKPQGSSSARQAVLDAAYSMIGSDYVYGACDPAGRRFDCSGFTMYCFSKAGISLPHYSESQANRTPKKSVSELLPGDLVWHPGHVGIYAGNGMLIDAGNERVGVSLRSLYGGWGQWRGGWPA
ncbi:C40 family peptidase [Granulimonas faecalis]|uniref:C40 family peptidase n=1 Tax=Granulimonas faecalis TaxID=2894155 RepID=UPI003515CD75